MKLVSGETEIDFMGKRKLAAILSVVLILVSTASLIGRSLNFGVDFTGGLLIEVGYETTADLENIRSRLANAGFEDAKAQNFGTEQDVLIRLMPREAGETGQPGGESPEAEDSTAKLGEQILQVLQSDGIAAELRRVEFVGPQVGRELTERGGTAMIFALLMILAYIMFRFQWKFAIGSVAALVHDVIIVIGVFSVLQLPFDLSVLAAILAVIGYSLNDTIVVFDRIRENFRQIRRGTSAAIMNTSINQMLGRTLITSLTTLVVLLALFFLGGEAVRGFATALIIGIVVGTYSSIYTASTTALALDVKPADLLEVKKEEVDDLP
ncbi:MAG: protein translocase subunit SecF [Chromatiales bacterium]|jgi:preprotein translocase subunit SecF|nr:protein translocase subunit SecF [Chromatiales bacterium]MDP6151329.1 protein translocase subunit SecF [Gammaproteobacteria bacterium]MDP7269926.1 protein translocase subunit SecF [Gammaproteobacteria bacterium]HJP04452.1 protein translocase subunit SecF [Gammaproteobacteria bacterium]